MVAQAMWSVAQAMWACCTGYVEQKLIIRQSQANLAEVEVGAELGKRTIFICNTIQRITHSNNYTKGFLERLITQKYQTFQTSSAIVKNPSRRCGLRL